MHISKNVSIKKVVTVLKILKMAILFLDFFGSDGSDGWMDGSNSQIQGTDISSSVLNSSENMVW